MAKDERDNLRRRRQEMVDRQIRARGIHHPDVLAVMAEIPRERFLPGKLLNAAYDDRALPIACGQTISQPYIVAYMTDKLAISPTSTVLEVGTGSGYQTAVLARLCHHVISIERFQELHDVAAERLRDLNISNVTLCVGDGSEGLEERAPFDRIIVTAAAPRAPKLLIDQLADQGRLIVPIGNRTTQTIVWFDRKGEEIVKTIGIGCRFVRLVGDAGWPE